MSQAFGYAGWIGFGEESTYGTPVTPTKFMEILEESMKLEQSRIGVPTLRQVGVFNSVLSRKSVSGSLRVQGLLTGWEALLKHGIGSVSTSGSTNYSHTYTPADAVPTGLTLHVNRDAASLGGSSAFAYHGCHVRRLTLTQEAEQPLIVEAEFIGEDESNVALATPTFPTPVLFDYSQFSATYNALAIAVRRFELSIENALADDRYNLGSRLRVGTGRNGPRKISGSMEVEFQNLTYLADFQALTQRELAANWTIDGTKALQINMPAVQLQGETPTNTGPGPIVANFTFEAFRETATDPEMSVSLLNQTASP